MTTSAEKAREVISQAYHEMLVSGDHKTSELADAILAALSAAGLVIVPGEPTDEMCRAANDARTQASYTDRTQFGNRIEWARQAFKAAVAVAALPTPANSEGKG